MGANWLRHFIMKLETSILLKRKNDSSQQITFAQPFVVSRISGRGCDQHHRRMGVPEPMLFHAACDRSINFARLSIFGCHGSVGLRHIASLRFRWEYCMRQRNIFGKGRNLFASPGFWRTIPGATTRPSPVATMQWFWAAAVSSFRSNPRTQGKPLRSPRKSAIPACYKRVLGPPDLPQSFRRGNSFCSMKRFSLF